MENTIIEYLSRGGLSARTLTRPRCGVFIAGFVTIFVQKKSGLFTNI